MRKLFRALPLAARVWLAVVVVGDALLFAIGLLVS